MSNSQQQRHFGILGATGVGVGAIVGGGILALAGVAFSAAGPAAILAFALNGGIALLTAGSFAEMSARFPESGGTYTFAKKVLSVQAAFMIGWIVWFASIVAALLYALGFASFALVALSGFAEHLPFDALWLQDPRLRSGLAVLATVFYASSLIRKTGGGGQWETVGKMILFTGLILAGFLVWFTRPEVDSLARLTPFFANGLSGLFQAMGYTFIALQGFDLIAAVGGEVREPARNIPRAMFYSLFIGLAIYLPFLFVIATVGVPAGQTISAMSTANPEAVVAFAARNYLGETGYWLVVSAAILSMLSAMQANLYAASRVAMAMAKDSTLPHGLGVKNHRFKTPVNAIVASTAMVLLLLCIITDVAAAGAVSSLIFLVSFALAHYTSILARSRSVSAGSFSMPWFPVLPVTGALACLILAIFQGVAVPRAGMIGLIWLFLGGILYLVIFARRAGAVDASMEARDPEAAKLRGRSPLVLVPIANPANAEGMVTVASALAPPVVGRVLLLSVIVDNGNWQSGEPHPQLLAAQSVLGEALTASFAAGLAPEALTTVAGGAWEEISRVASIHGCESLLLGFHSLDQHSTTRHLEEVMSRVNCDVVVLRARPMWQLANVNRIVVPIGGRGAHSLLRARLLGSLCRTGQREIVYVRILAADAAAPSISKAKRQLKAIARDEAPGASRVEVLCVADPLQELIRLSTECDLMILGLQRLGKRRKMFGSFALTIAQHSDCPLIMISRAG